MNDVSRTLVTIGLVLVVAGLAWPLVAKLGLFRLPGDIAVERGNFRFYFPLATMLLLNVALWILVRLFGGPR